MLYLFGKVRAAMLHQALPTSSIWSSQHVAERRNRVAKREQHAALINVAIRCISMLRSFAGACKCCA